ncbi:hypothetical protein ACRE_070570 [Hapsidospora chrysogenum ATCC 11550]|uniref:DUF3669 domain-containing protein n=1 Tax=Hapsidospora chrysogenum (strain ATCC 11550 / CBS 779.69 / DSM 880 / IAM 14645 / JCM 23072 / IMI 49137) TaxID=857340 RepID=A0A086SYL9_HAPC1|nr:hypothetical protein ACRE_070570 [Hapsidospora chrysogenum ATCC 11550]
MSSLYVVASHYLGLLQDGDGGTDYGNRTAGNKDIVEEDWDHVGLEDYYVDDDGDDVGKAGVGKLTTEGDSRTQDYVDQNGKDKTSMTNDTHGKDVRSASNVREEAGKGKAKEGPMLHNVDDDFDDDDGLFPKGVTQQGGQVNAQSRPVKENTSANGVRTLPTQRPYGTRPRTPVGLPIPEYASAVGEALAVMHWSAWLHGDGVKFALGNETDPDARDTQASGSTAAQGVKGTSPPNDMPRLWILGFDLCSHFESVAMPGEPEKLLAHLSDTFLRNSAYYPHPRPVDARGRAVWHMFRDAYLDRSGKRLVDRGQVFWRLPDEFLRQVAQETGRPGTPRIEENEWLPPKINKE